MTAGAIEGSSRAEAKQRIELAQLQRLRQWREDAARVCRDARAADHAAALAAVHERERRIAQLRSDIARLTAFVAGDGAPRMAQLTPYATARRVLLDDQLERAEYGLIDDQEVLAETEQALARAQAALLRASLHQQAMARLCSDTQRLHARAGERRVERDGDQPAQLAGQRG